MENNVINMKQTFIPIFPDFILEQDDINKEKDYYDTSIKCYVRRNFNGYWFRILVCYVRRTGKLERAMIGDRDLFQKNVTISVMKGFNRSIYSIMMSPINLSIKNSNRELAWSIDPDQRSEHERDPSLM